MEYIVLLENNIFLDLNLDLLYILYIYIFIFKNSLIKKFVYYFENNLIIKEYKA